MAGILRFFLSLLGVILALIMVCIALGLVELLIYIADHIG